MTSRDVAVVIGITLTWGIAFVGIKEVLASSPALTTAGIRFELGGLLLLPLLPLVRRRRTGPGAKTRSPRLAEMAGIGLLQTTGLYGFGFLGITHATAGASALLINTNPVFVAVLAVPFLGERLRTAAVAGLALAVGGVALISVKGGFGSALGITLLLVSAACWALGSIAIKRTAGTDLLRLNCGQMIIGGIPLLALGIVTEHRLPHPGAKAVAWFAFLVVVATSINFVAWFDLLERFGAVAVTSWLFLIPVFGVVSGALLLHEPVGWRLVVGGALVVAGVVLAQDRSPQAPPIVDAPG